MKKVLILVVAYNVEDHIYKVLKRIPESFYEDGRYQTEILVIDDASNDSTAAESKGFAAAKNNIRVLKNPVNQGYGGNQKIGYHYAIMKEMDIVVLLHGDGQYAPEYLEKMVEPLAKEEVDAVFGSRMMKKSDALKGGMPLYKFLGNIILSKFQNVILRANLSEFHSGYRAYRVDALKKIPFHYNSNYFDFDTDIIIQLLDNNQKIKEIPIPTYYGDEISYVNGIKYARKILISSVLSRLQKIGFYFHPKFDYQPTSTRYESKIDFDSSHSFALKKIKPGSLVIEFGCGEGFLGKELSQKQCEIYGFDLNPNESSPYYKQIKKVNLDSCDIAIKDLQRKVSCILMLDVLEHLDSPENFLKKVRDIYGKDRPEIIITTSNIAFFSMRIGLFFGRFTYKKRGILDITHKRLFTFSSLKSILINELYEVVKVVGIPAPFPLVVKNDFIAGTLLKLNRGLIYLSKGLFSFQIAIIAKPTPTLKALLNDASENI